jgi:hypothetical protein
MDVIEGSFTPFKKIIKPKIKNPIEGKNHISTPFVNSHVLAYEHKKSKQDMNQKKNSENCVFCFHRTVSLFPSKHLFV